MSSDSELRSAAGLETPPEQPAVNPLASDPELLNDFILESREHLTSIELQLLALDQDPADREAINAVFRGFHTIKGMAGFLDLDAVRDVAHEVETVLDMARNSQLVITSAVVDGILASKDYLSREMAELEAMLQTGSASPPRDNVALLAAIRSLANPVAVPGPDQIIDTPIAAAPPAAAPIEMGGRADSVQHSAAPEESSASGLIQLAREVAATPSAAAIVDEPGEMGLAGSVEAAESPKTPEALSVTARSIKVDTAKLDHLVDMVGEMVIAQSLVRHDPDLATSSKPRLARNLSQLARITDDVQRTAMSMRMIPIGQLFQKTSRLVRDLSRKAAKQVDLELAGEDTELDRNIVEELADPLMHMVRNAVDHGIETPEERLRVGKSGVARVTLKAGHQAGHIVIQISDDGRGLDQEKILRKAREKGLIDPDAQLSESEIFNLIFLPGFSTAEKITDVSGRGVGMDVVRKHVQKLRGRIDVQSVLGQGTTFLLKLPLTLAIIDGLVVGVGKQRFIVPIFAVREMLKPAQDAIATVRGREEMAMVRGALLPVVRLHQRFQVQPRFENPWESLLIVSESRGKQFCLMVDELIGKQEVVIKSLGETMQNIPGVAGGAILGDGLVGLILDLEGLFAENDAAGSGRVSMPEIATTLPAMVLSDREFKQISQLAHERFGLELKPGKEALVAARLGKRLRQRGFQSFADYYRHVLSDASGEALTELIDSLTTNHTSFLRERAHFEFLAEAVVGEFASARTLEIWSAACSSGEEPYSIAMCVADALSRARASTPQLRILATDISTRVLAMARRAVYPVERFRELSESWCRTYLLKGRGESSGLYKVKPELIRLVEFKQLNLIEPFSHGRRFHVIFCRNVMMYFDKATQYDIVTRLCGCLEPGGYLLVGHSESLTGVQHGLEYVRPALYRRKTDPGGLGVWS